MSFGLNTGISRRLFTLVGILAILTAPTLADAGSSIKAAKTPPTSSEAVKSAPTSSGRALWKWSLAAYGTANALDIISSTGPHNGHETNSLLTNSTGNFDVGKAIAVKGGVFAGAAVAEYLLLRKWPQLTKVFSIVNFGWSAAETGVAADNVTLRK